MASEKGSGYVIRQATEEDVPTLLRLIHALAAYEREPPSTIQATEASLLRTLSFPSNPSKGYAKALLIYPAEPSTSNPHDSPADKQRDAGADKSRADASGMAVYFYNYSTWTGAPGVYLEDLFVRPEWRGRGFGRALLREMGREALRVAGEAHAVGGESVANAEVETSETGAASQAGAAAAASVDAEGREGGEGEEGGKKEKGKGNTKGRVEWSVLKWNQPSIDFYESEGVGARKMDGWWRMRVEGEGVGRLAGL